MAALTFRDLLKDITPALGVSVMLMTLLLASNLISLAGPWLAGEITAAILGDAGTISVPLLLVLWLLVLVATNLVNFIADFQTSVQGEYMCANLRSKLHEHMQDLPVSHFYDSAVGDVLAYFTNDIENVGYFVTENVLPIVPMLVLLISTFVLMASTSLLIALVTVILLPCYYIAVKLIGRNLRGVSNIWMRAYADIVSLLEQRLGNITLIKVFSNREAELHAFDDKNERYVEVSRRQHLLQSAISPITSTLAALGLVLVLWLGSLEIDAGELTPAELVMLILFANLMRAPLAGLANLYGQIQKTRGVAVRLVDLLNTRTEEVDGEPVDLQQANISIRNLSFGYIEPLLVNASAQIKAGEVVAIVGANGAGKTTLAFLIMSLIRPSPGQIFISDQDVATMSPAGLRQHVSLVSQNTLLLNDTIASNISLSQDHDFTAVQSAAQAVKAHAFIESLPDKYHTIIGNQGLRISGGQRQKIALARAMYKDAPILILDEPTSMFDEEAESAFIEGCETLFSGRTVILITHSSRLLHLADRVIEIKDKKLVERSPQLNAIVN